MSPNVKIRQGRAARAAAPAVLNKTLTGKKGSFPRQIIPPERFRRNRIFNVFHPHKSGGDFRVYDGIDYKMVVFRKFFHPGN